MIKLIAECACFYAVHYMEGGNEVLEPIKSVQNMLLTDLVALLLSNQLDICLFLCSYF